MTNSHEQLHDVLDLMVCETCECDIVVPDERADLGVCRQCGTAFLVPVGEPSAHGGRTRDARRVG